MTLTVPSQIPATMPTPPSSAPDTAGTSPVRELFNDGNVKIEQIYEEETDSKGNTYVLREEVRITTSDKADQVRIHAGADGQVNARINGQLHQLPLDRGDPYQTLIITTAGGDDRVVVDPDINVAVNISTGDGNDRIIAGGGNTRVFAGKGDDFIRLGSGKGLAFGEDGNDLMLAGTGDAVMSGGKGEDRMYAGLGPAHRVVYLSGDEGNDELYGGDGKVVLNGGLDNDKLVGYRRTTMYTGGGQDSVHSFDANDSIYAKNTDSIHNHKGAAVTEVRTNSAGKHGFKIEGSPEFIARVENKLEELRGSPVGQKLLEEMDRLAKKIGHPVLISSAPEDGNISTYHFETAFTQSLTRKALRQYDDKPEIGHIKDGVPGAIATQAKIVFASDTLDWRLGVSPLIALFHEMIHAYNGATGTRIPGSQPLLDKDGQPVLRGGEPVSESIDELQAVGIPNAGEAFDFDNDPSTPPTTINPYPLYENALRKELDIPLRERYYPI
ncbi:MULTISPECIES: M91 family zinc metallopeptidase [Pseudomonas]|uniref:Hemolysin n=1 Tax=Pseudomonas reactans TaxID=117680 RepID=A0A7Y8FWK1_9PSED|nr:M91 family zinc metallopeptidase [Pseudomonas reactans]NWE86881.1 hemolysin [Pseudomonas reactans]